jgi:hypothetical protein
MGTVARNQHADRATTGVSVTTSMHPAATGNTIAVPMSLFLNRATVLRDSLPAVALADGRLRAA